jgi:hypothetical protein
MSITVIRIAYKGFPILIDASIVKKSSILLKNVGNHTPLSPSQDCSTEKSG